MHALADELRRLAKQRIKLAELRSAFLRAYPEAETAPDQRRLLLEALQSLARDGVLDLPIGGWDASGTPSLPRTVGLRNAAPMPPADAPYAWLPELAFAASEQNPARRVDLRAINTFLLSQRGCKLAFVPTRERSLQIFGDEKRLDRLRKGNVTLFEGRVSLEAIGCYPVAPPLPCESPAKPAGGRPILVLENHHSFESFRRWNSGAAEYAAVAYGGGNAFRQGAGNLDDLIRRTAASGAIYLGDLDPAGTQILIGVNEARAAEGQKPLLPHLGLYKWLLAHGCRCPLDAPPTERTLAEVERSFPKEIAQGLLQLWVGRERVPQESFGSEQLNSDSAAFANSAAAY